MLDKLFNKKKNSDKLYISLEELHIVEEEMERTLNNADAARKKKMTFKQYYTQRVPVSILNKEGDFVCEIPKEKYNKFEKGED